MRPFPLSSKWVPERFSSPAGILTARLPSLPGWSAREWRRSASGFSGEPTIPRVGEGVELARAEGCDIVIAFGGGSAIDGAKGIAALLGNGGHPLDYLEVVGEGRKLTKPSAPFVAIPTTAGTGSEVTRNAVLASPEHRVKASLRSPQMLARLAVIDPELTYCLPPGITAATGLDALTQLIEPYVSIKANPLTDGVCLEGIKRAGRSLKRVCEDGGDSAARRDMALASLFGGLALANAKLGAVHGFAAPLGGMFPAPHGAVCAALLPHVMRANIEALRERSPDGESLSRYQTVAAILTGRSDAAPEDGADWTASLCNSLGIPPLRQFGVTEEDIPALVEKGGKASSMKGNPLPLSEDELAGVLRAAL